MFLQMYCSALLKVNKAVTMWTALLLSLILSTVWQPSFAQNNILESSGVEGVTTDFKILCPASVTEPLASIGAQIFWKINQTPYKVSEVPSPFLVNRDDFSLVITGLLHRAFNGYMFQCIGIEWGDGPILTKEYLGSVIKLVVIHNSQDFVLLDYQHLSIGPSAVEIHVLPHPAELCNTLPLHVEAYTPDQTSADIFNISQESSIIDSTNWTFLIRWEDVADGEGFVFRLGAEFCATDTTNYHQLQPNNIPTLVSATAGSSQCLPLPLDLLSSGESLEMVWPKTPHSTGDCVCPPYEGTRMQFSHCASAKPCNTEYSVSVVDNGAACFTGLTSQQNDTPVYFTVVRAVPCRGEDGTVRQCYIRRIATSYRILMSEDPDDSTVVLPTREAPECSRDSCNTAGLDLALREPAVAVLLAILLFLLMVTTLILVLTWYTCYCRRRRGSISMSEHNMYTKKQSSVADANSRDHNALMLSISRASADSKQSRLSEIPVVPSDYCTPIDALREAFPERDFKKMKGVKPLGAKEAGESRVGFGREAKKAVKRAKSLNTVVDQVTYDEPITALSYRSLENKDKLYENVVITPSEAIPMPIETAPISSEAAPRRETMPSGSPHSKATNQPRGRRIATINERVPSRPSHSSQVHTKQNDLSELYQNLKEIR